MCFRTSISILSFILSTLAASVQNMEPLDLAKRIFNPKPFPEIQKYCIGEYQGRPNGQDLKDGANTKFLLLGQTNSKAVVAMTILDSAGSGLDTYLHFTKDTIWKMQAFRALAMTGMMEMAKNELEKLTLRQVDSLVELSKGAKEKKDVAFTSRDDYYFQLGNLKLALELDENIIRHFQKNRAEFERIKDSALKELKSKKTDGDRAVRLVEDLEADYRKLLIYSVSYGGYELGGSCLDFSIGGILDNTVGILYIREKEDLPEMGDGRIIMLREIGDGWYLYKTT